MHWLPILFGYDAFWNVATILALSPVSYLLGKLAVAGVRRLPRRRSSRARAARFLLLLARRCPSRS